MSRPVIALLTDFGTHDHYVATMKAVALGICADLTLVDISHEVPPHDVVAGALELAACYRYFPAGTIFLVVIDPGVGSGRRALVAEAGDYRYVAPDNGVLSLVFDETPPRRTVELTARRYARPSISHTFEGRDRFAPAAAWIARGVDLSGMGRAVHDIRRLDVPRPDVGADAIAGEVIRVDRFGNLVTNIDRRTFERVADGAGRLDVRAGTFPVAKVVSTYADAEPGEICAVFGSTDHLEVAASGSSAADTLGLGRGAPVHVSRHA